MAGLSRGRGQSPGDIVTGEEMEAEMGDMEAEEEMGDMEELEEMDEVSWNEKNNPAKTDPTPNPIIFNTVSIGNKSGSVFRMFVTASRIEASISLSASLSLTA